MSALRSPRPLPFLCIAHALDHMFMAIYPFIAVIPAFERDMGLTYGGLLSLSVVGWMLFGLGAPAAGWLADRWSGSGMMILFFVGIGLSSVLTGLADSPLMIAIGLSLIGLFASIYHPVGIAMVIQTAGDRRGRHLGINGVFGSAGMALASLVAASLTALVSWRAAFIVPGLVSIALGLLFAVLFRNGIAVVEPGKVKERPQTGLREFVRVMAAIGVMTVFSGMVFQSMTVGLPKFLDHRIAWLQGDAVTLGVVVTAILLTGGAAQLVGGLLTDRFPLKQIYFVLYGAMIPLFLIAAATYGTPLILLMIVALAIPVGIQPVADTLFAHYIPPKWLSTAFGFRFALSLTVSAAAVPMLGFIFDLSGDFVWLFLILAGFAAGVIGAVAMLPRRGPAEAAAPAAAAVPAE